jgi:multidrug efflux system membrane fusion protein
MHCKKGRLPVVSSPPATRGSSRRNIAIIAGLLILAIGIGVAVVRRGVVPVEAARGKPPTVPVSVATAARQDVPIQLVGLGTVQATFTIGIHSQVDGKLQDVRFKEGQHVKKGDVLAKIDPRLFQAALDQAKAKKAQDQATLIGLQKDLDRFKSLGIKGFETQQNIDEQQAKVDTATATITADDAAIETAQTQLDYTDIRAPSDGRMGVRLVDPGNVVHASDQGAIAVLVQAQPAAVMFTLPAATLDDVRAAQRRGDVQVVAYDRDNRKALSTGALATIDNVIDPTTATYRLKATFLNKNEELWPGEFVNAHLLVNTEKNALVVPNTAIQRGPNGLFIWTVTAQNTATPAPVKVGPQVGDITVVTAGLRDGQHVITAGQYKLRTNSPIDIADASVPEGNGRP